MSDKWDFPYTREQAAYPAPWIHTRGKLFPSVSRVDSTFGDRNPVCECPSVADYLGEYYELEAKKKSPLSIDKEAPKRSESPSEVLL